MIATATGITIAAPAATIFAYAAATERWPLILPHYRYVRLHAGDATRRIVEMAAWRDVFPLHWIAEQVNDPATPHIAFRHIAGPVRGMEVAWRFVTVGVVTEVTIEHRLDAPSALVATPLGTWFAGEYAIAGVARRTLACMKRVAEGIA